MKKYLKNISEKGSMMVEALAMLGLITMVTPILYKKAAERTTELQDINTATQLRTMSKALDDYIKDNYTTLKDTMATDKINIDPEMIKDYLPYNFETASKLFDDFSFSIRRSTIPAANPDDEGTASFTGVVLAPLANEGDLPRIRASKIASMVGANGGIVEGTDIKGVQGTWNAPVADFIFQDADGDNIDVKPNSLAISSVHAVTSSSGGEAAPPEDVLYRTPQDDPVLNTMETALLMGGNDIKDVVKIIAKDNKFTLGENGNITATGDVSGANIIATGNLGGATANITGLLNAGSVEIGGTLGVTGLSTLTGGVKTGIINDDASDLTIGGAVTANKALTVTGTITGNSGIIAKGEAESGYALVVEDHDLLVKENAKISGLLTVENINAETINSKYSYVEKEFGAGLIDGATGVPYNFVAGKDIVTIANPNFIVGEDSGGTQLKTNSDGIEMEGDKVSITGTSGVTIKGDTEISGVNENAKINVKGMDGEISLVAYGKINTKVDRSGDVYAELDLSESGFKLSSKGAGVSGGDGYLQMSAIEDDGYSSITSLGSAISMDLYNSSGNQKASASLNDASGVTSFDVAAAEAYFDVDGTYFAGEKDENNYLTGKGGVYIHRSGINVDSVDRDGNYLTLSNILNDNDGGSIALQTPGYILADRLVSNVAFPKTEDGWGVGEGVYNNASGVTGTVSYDAYQVNPAYTSVMHDIKLTTRGGARLSDILPDFINKGIYVLDNTYKESDNTKLWELYTVNPASGNGDADAMVSGKPDECSSSDCIASPWLGFVPTPQCPPGYSKVITISPIRWKMSEAYYVAGTSAITAADLKSDPANFRKYFHPSLNPLTDQLTIKVDENTDTEGAHTHSARVLGYGDEKQEYALPLTFQTNTWLNTTISGVYSEDGGPSSAVGSGDTGGQRMSTFVGWHAIMGFLYYVDEYKDYLTGLGAWKDEWAPESGKGSGIVIWNLFPVYNEEMTAIANVYCYFERRSWTGETAWEWNRSYVDGGDPNASAPEDRGYDQLTNFRFGFEKNNEAYNKRLNDPALGYNEVW